MFNKKYKLIAAILLIVLIAFFSLFFFLINLSSVQRYAMRHIGKETGLEISASEIKLDIGISPKIIMKNFKLLSEKRPVFSAPDISMVIKLTDIAGFLINGELAAVVEAVMPLVALSGNDENGVYNPERAVLDGKIFTTQRVFQINSLEVFGKESSLTAQGKMDYRSEISPHLDIVVKSPIMTVKSFKSLIPAAILPEFISIGLLPLIKTGNIQVSRFFLNGDFNQIQSLSENSSVLGMDMEIHDLSFHFPQNNDLEFNDFSMTLSINDGLLVIDSIKGRFENSTVRNSSVVFPEVFEGKKLTVKLDSEIFFEDLMKLQKNSLLPETFQNKLDHMKALSGYADVLLEFDYEPDKDFTFFRKTSVVLREIRISHPDLRLPLSLMDSKISSDEGDLLVFKGTGKWGQTSFSFDGRADSSISQISSEISSKSDVGELLRIMLPEMSIGNWTYGDLSARARLDQRGVTVDKAVAEIGKGFLEFKGRVEPEKKSLINYTLIMDESVQKLIRIFKPQHDLIDGSFFLEGLFSIDDSDGSGSFSGLNGKAKFYLNNGWLHHSSKILGILDIINIDRWLMKGESRLRDGKFHFDKVEGEFEIESGKIIVQNLTLQSPLVNASAAGSIDLNRELIQLKIGLQPLGSIDSMVSNIPLIGGIMAGKEKALVVYYVDVTGSLDNPKIQPAPLRNIGKSALGYAERLVFTPERVLKFIMSIKEPRPPAHDFRSEYEKMTP